MSAPLGQTPTQAGDLPSAWRPAQKVHFRTTGSALMYWYFGTPNGPVSYDGSRCMGCRYCMVACPFQVPKYEYSKAIPIVRKCTFCAGRQAEGKLPACAQVCPSGALTFGKRGDLVAKARQLVYGNPGKYTQHVYGEHEAGGTKWMYVTDIPFEKLGFEVAVDDT